MLIIKMQLHVDIVEVVDSSSTTPTILHQAKPLETSSFLTVFLFPFPDATTNGSNGHVIAGHHRWTYILLSPGSPSPRTMHRYSQPYFS